MAHRRARRPYRPQSRCLQCIHWGIRVVGLKREGRCDYWDRVVDGGRVADEMCFVKEVRR